MLHIPSVQTMPAAIEWVTLLRTTTSIQICKASLLPPTQHNYTEWAVSFASFYALMYTVRKSQAHTSSPRVEFISSRNVFNFTQKSTKKCDSLFYLLSFCWLKEVTASINLPYNYKEICGDLWISKNHLY